MFYKAIVKWKRLLQAASHVIQSTAAANTSMIFSRVFVMCRISFSDTVCSTKGNAFRRTLSTRHRGRRRRRRSRSHPTQRSLTCPYSSTPSLPTWYPHPPQVQVLGALLLRNMSRVWVTSTRSNYPSGSAFMDSDYMRTYLAATWTRSSRATPHTMPILKNSSIENSNPACACGHFHLGK